MFKIIWLFKRKEGISLEQFRDHYESSHSELGKKYLGHLISRYVRNYVQPADPARPSKHPFTYDCITEWTMNSAEAFDEALRIFKDPVIGAIFREDEKHFLQPESITLVLVDPRDTGTGDAAASRALTTGAGAAAA